MPIEEDVIRLLYEVKGAAALADAQKDLANIGRLVDALKASYQAGSVTEEEFARQTRALATAQAEAARQVAGWSRAVEAAAQAERDLIGRTQATTAALGAQATAAGRVEAATTKVGSTAADAARKTKGYGEAAVTASRISQDAAQGGLYAIINNLEQVGTSFAKATGRSIESGNMIGGALMGIGVVALLAGPPIKRFIESLEIGPAKTFASELEAVKAALEKLVEKPYKLAVDYQAIRLAEDRIREMTEALAAFEATRKSTAQKELAAAGKEAVETIGSVKLREKLKEFDQARPGTIEFGPEYRKLQEQLRDTKEELAIAERMATSPDVGAEAQVGASLQIGYLKPKLAELNEKVRRAYDRQIEAFIGELEKGNEAVIAYFKKLAEERPEELGTPLAAALVTMPGTTEEVREGHKEDVDVKRQIEDAKLDKQAKAQRAARARADDALRRQEEAALAATEREQKAEQTRQAHAAKAALAEKVRQATPIVEAVGKGLEGPGAITGLGLAGAGRSDAAIAAEVNRQLRPHLAGLLPTVPAEILDLVTAGLTEKILERMRADLAVQLRAGVVGRPAQAAGALRVEQDRATREAEAAREAARKGAEERQVQAVAVEVQAAGTGATDEQARRVGERAVKIARDFGYSLDVMAQRIQVVGQAFIEVNAELNQERLRLHPAGMMGPAMAQPGGLHSVPAAPAPAAGYGPTGLLAGAATGALGDLSGLVTNAAPPEAPVTAPAPAPLPPPPQAQVTPPAPSALPMPFGPEEYPAPPPPVAVPPPVAALAAAATGAEPPAPIIVLPPPAAPAAAPAPGPPAATVPAASPAPAAHPAHAAAPAKPTEPAPPPVAAAPQGDFLDAFLDDVEALLGAGTDKQLGAMKRYVSPPTPDADLERIKQGNRELQARLNPPREPPAAAPAPPAEPYVSPLPPGPLRTIAETATTGPIPAPAAPIIPPLAIGAPPPAAAAAEPYVSPLPSGPMRRFAETVTTGPIPAPVAPIVPPLAVGAPAPAPVPVQPGVRPAMPAAFTPPPIVAAAPTVAAPVARPPTALGELGAFLGSQEAAVSGMLGGQQAELGGIFAQAGAGADYAGVPMPGPPGVGRRGPRKPGERIARGQAMLVAKRARQAQRVEAAKAKKAERARRGAAGAEARRVTKTKAGALAERDRGRAAERTEAAAPADLGGATPAGGNGKPAGPAAPPDVMGAVVPALAQYQAILGTLVGNQTAMAAAIQQLGRGATRLNRAAHDVSRTALCIGYDAQ